VVRRSSRPSREPHEDVVGDAVHDLLVRQDDGVQAAEGAGVRRVPAPAKP
jgi:hypothetical protein